MKRHLDLILALVVALSTMLVGSAAAGPAGAAPPKSTFAWTPASLELTVARGSGTNANVSFVSTRKLVDMSITAKGQIPGFVTPSPATLSLVAAGTTVPVSLAVAVPVSTALGDYTGQIDVAPAKQKPGDDSLPEKKPTADTLPVTIHVVAPVPTGHIYWSNGNIGRADLDGLNSNPNFIALLPAANATGVAVDAQYVYWTDSNSGSIGRANLDGSNPNPSFIVLSNPSQMIGIAVDAQYIYWADAQAQSIGRANLDGSNVLPLFASTGLGSLPFGVAVDAAHIYWTEQTTGSIGRADLDGSNVDSNFMVGVGGVPAGVAVDAQKIYWTYQTSQATAAIGRADLDGSNPNQGIITGGSFVGVEVDGQHLYWADTSTGSIGRANLDGSNPNPSFITADAFFVAVAG